MLETEGSTHTPAASEELTHNVGEDLGADERAWLPRAIDALDRTGVPFAVAGAFALNYHSGLWRGTKDLDVLILPADRERAIAAVTEAGFRDLFPEEAYDRGWIYRATRDGVIFDMIWALANYAGEVDAGWLERSVEARFLERPVRVVSAADLCGMKLFVFQKQRCDWPDLFNVIRGTAGKLDWDHLLAQAGPHWQLLVGLTAVYDWLCPAETSFIPAGFRQALAAKQQDTPERGGGACRAELFDSRPWLTDPGEGRAAS